MKTVLDTAQQAQDKTGANASSIRKVCNGQRNKAGEYKWKWADEASVGPAHGFSPVDHGAIPIHTSDPHNFDMEEDYDNEDGDEDDWNDDNRNAW